MIFWLPSRKGRAPRRSSFVCVRLSSIYAFLFCSFCRWRDCVPESFFFCPDGGFRRSGSTTAGQSGSTTADGSTAADGSACCAGTGGSVEAGESTARSAHANSGRTGGRGSSPDPDAGFASRPVSSQLGTEGVVTGHGADHEGGGSRENAFGNADNLQAHWNGFPSGYQINAGALGAEPQ